MIEVLIQNNQLYAESKGQRFPLQRLTNVLGSGWLNSELLRDKQAWEEFLNG